MIRRAALSAVLFLTTFTLSCKDSPLAGPEGVAPLFAPAGACTPWPACKDGGDSGGPGGGGEADYNVTLAAALVGNGDVQGTKDTRKHLFVEGESFDVTAVNFDAVASLNVVDAGTTAPVCNGNDPLSCACVLGGLEGLVGIQTSSGSADPADVRAEVIAHLQAVLTAAGALDRKFLMQIHKRTLGEQHGDNFLSLRPLVESEENLLQTGTTQLRVPGTVMTRFDWGRNNPSTGDFLRVEGDPNTVNNQNAERTFTLREGTVRMVGRLGPNASDPLIGLVCDVPDGITATATVCPADGCPE